MKRLKKQQWFILILVGFSGQLAWMLENMYLNVYLYNELGGTPQDIAWMVALSAITATVTTLLMGSISDKMGKRKPLIVIGYLIWGVTVLGFSFIHPDFLGQFVPVVHVAGLSVFLLILWDCVMTFLGSSANDAAFNAWITDTTHPEERGRVESVLAILPLMAMLFLFGLLDPLTQNGQWGIFFTIIGIFVFITGLLALIFVKDGEIVSSQLSLKDTIQYGFKKETIQANKNLYLSFILLLVIGISTQVWTPYLIIYIQKGLLIEDYAIILGLVLTIASISSVFVGRIIDQKGKLNLLPVGLLIQVFGLIGMLFAKET
ncbi:MAG: MFS transporter, partial [Erysipelothrix sp.]|nr:MFS transporter [Erysipelothrix sp.]